MVQSGVYTTLIFAKCTWKLVSRLYYKVPGPPTGKGNNLCSALSVGLKLYVCTCSILLFIEIANLHLTRGSDAPQAAYGPALLLLKGAKSSAISNKLILSVWSLWVCKGSEKGIINKSPGLNYVGQNGLYTLHYSVYSMQDEQVHFVYEHVQCKLGGLSPPSLKVGGAAAPPAPWWLPAHDHGIWLLILLL